jgi:hypothetical protein
MTIEEQLLATGLWQLQRAALCGNECARAVVQHIEKIEAENQRLTQADAALSAALIGVAYAPAATHELLREATSA